MFLKISDNFLKRFFHTFTFFFANYYEKPYKIFFENYYLNYNNFWKLVRIFIRFFFKKLYGFSAFIRFFQPYKNVFKN